KTHNRFSMLPKRHNSCLNCSSFINAYFPPLADLHGLDFRRSRTTLGKVNNFGLNVISCCSICVKSHSFIHWYDPVNWCSQCACIRRHEKSHIIDCVPSLARSSEYRRRVVSNANSTARCSTESKRSESVPLNT